MVKENQIGASPKHPRGDSQREAVKTICPERRGKVNDGSWKLLTFFSNQIPRGTAYKAQLHRTRLSERRPKQ